jgi:hypothetical protein
MRPSQFFDLQTTSARVRLGPKQERSSYLAFEILFRRFTVEARVKDRLGGNQPTRQRSIGKGELFWVAGEANSSSCSLFISPALRRRSTRWPLRPRARDMPLLTVLSPVIHKAIRGSRARSSSNRSTPGCTNASISAKRLLCAQPSLSRKSTKKCTMPETATSIGFRKIRQVAY